MNVKKLSVKELASALGRNPSFVYKMRAAGFPMAWDETSRCYVATFGAARSWIKKTGFKIVRGKTVVT